MNVQQYSKNPFNSLLYAKSLKEFTVLDVQLDNPSLQGSSEPFALADIEIIRNDSNRKKSWHVVRRDETTLVTHLGPVKYKKTLFRHKETGEYAYLLDKIMGLAPHTRMTEDAVAKVLEEAVQTSYQKGGENACITIDLSLIHI